MFLGWRHKKMGQELPSLVSSRRRRRSILGDELMIISLSYVSPSISVATFLLVDTVILQSFYHATSRVLLDFPLRRRWSIALVDVILLQLLLSICLSRDVLGFPASILSLLKQAKLGSIIRILWCCFVIQNVTQASIGSLNFHFQRLKIIYFFVKSSRNYLIKSQGIDASPALHPTKYRCSLLS